MKVGFVIPFKPRRNTKDWDTDNSLLVSTIKSVLRQTCSDLSAYVIYTDEPLNPIPDPRLKYLKYPYPYLVYDEISGNENELIYHKDKILLERRMDKSKKIMWGCKVAKEDGCNYIMSVDADDLISNKISEFVSKNNNNGQIAGWFISKGLVLKINSNWALKNFDMNSFNGSTHIVREDLIKIPDFEKGKYIDFNLFTAHGWTVYRMRDIFKQELKAIPFWGVVYIVHQNNTSSVLQIFSSTSLKNLIKKIVRFKFMNKRIKKEFSVSW